MAENSFSNAGLRIRFFFMDAGALVGVPLCIVHFRLWTVALALLLMLFFAILEWRGLRPLVFLTIVRLRVGALFARRIHVFRPRYHARRLADR